MITTTDSINTINFGNYYVILPSTLSELWDKEEFRLTSSDKPGVFCEHGFSYSSETNEDFLSVKDLQKLIRENTDL